MALDTSPILGGAAAVVSLSVVGITVVDVAGTNMLGIKAAPTVVGIIVGAVRNDRHIERSATAAPPTMLDLNHEIAGAIA
jgi:hypothetical protein